MINEKNYDYLKNQVKYAGFGENLDQELKEKMEQQKSEFTIPHQAKFGQDEVNSELHFKKSKESELYFFNSYELALKQPQSEDVLKQTYFVGKENNLTLKERYNMLDNRAVFKEFNKLEKVTEGDKVRLKPTDETYKSWALLNFKETDTQGNFLIRKLFWDHEKTLTKFPIKDLEDNYDKSRLIASLEKGNMQRAIVVQDGREVKVSMSANPIDKTFNFYDTNMERIEVKQIQMQKQDDTTLKQDGNIASQGQHESNVPVQGQEDAKVVSLQKNHEGEPLTNILPEAGNAEKEDNSRSLKVKNNDSDDAKPGKRPRMRVS